MTWSEIFTVFEIRQQSAEVEESKKHILALDGPGYGLYVQRMDSEVERNEKGDGQGIFPTDFPKLRKATHTQKEQEGIGKVQEPVDEMKNERTIAKQRMLHDPHRVHERFVMGRIDLTRPGTRQVVLLNDGVAQNEIVVIQRDEIIR